MQITPASAHNEAAIKQLLRSCDLPFEDITTSHLRHFFIVSDGAQSDSAQIEAVVGLEVGGEFGLLRSLAVVPSRRGQGLGIRLVEHMEAYALSQQIAALYLLTTTADGFFAHLGYEVISRASAPAALQVMAEFQSICPDSAICMQKVL